MEAFFDELSRGLAKTLTRREAFRVTIGSIVVALWPQRAAADSCGCPDGAPTCCGDCVNNGCTNGLCIQPAATCCHGGGANWGCIVNVQCCFVGGCCPSDAECCAGFDSYDCCNIITSTCTTGISGSDTHCCNALLVCVSVGGTRVCCTDSPSFCASVCPPRSHMGASAFGFDAQQPASILYNFAGIPDGANPLAGLIQDANGTLYGTTNAGGSSGMGTIFKLAPDGSGHTVLHNFAGGSSDGANPDASLFQGSFGTLFGTTQGGGSAGVGTVFSMAPDGSAFTVLHSFSGTPDDGAVPHGGVIQGLDGNLYGTTHSGGSANFGAIFRIASDGSGFTLLHQFAGGGADGGDPRGGLIQGPDGTLYGVTVSGGGTENLGTIFSIKPDGTGFVLLHVFTSATTDGSYPFGALIRGRDGALYGTTRTGGSADLGTVFRIATDGSGFTILHNFVGNPTDGAHPFASLIQGSDGKLYGTTANGGTNRIVGTIFQLVTDGSAYTVRHIFDVDPSDGALPFASLLQAHDGTLYGTASKGGASSDGVVFRLTIASRPASGDFFGDSKAAYAVFRPSEGNWYLLDSNAPGNTLVQQWGLSGDVPLRGDFDGDGKSDFAVWRPSTGQWFIIPSSNPGTPITQSWGLNGDIPVPGDYDGDGKTDFAVWRPSTGQWFIIPSGNPGSPITQSWGLNGDIPVPGDYDGDGITDFAIWRPSSGQWFIIPSSNPGTPITQSWGLNGDVPVPGDYDGDGNTDFAVWRPSAGQWFVIPSSNPGSPLTQSWGLNGDIPVPLDYDGDRKTDFAVWRSSTGQWFVIPSATPNSPTVTSWGLPGDIPVQRPIGQ